MTITDAQADVRRIYRGGYAGPLVSAVVWAVANIVYQVVSPGAGMATLFFGGMLIFPLSSLILKVTTGESALPKGHPSTGLAVQSAITLPFGLLIAIALGGYAPNLFFPASLVLVGTHYFVFVSLYGMRAFAVLGGTLAALGLVGIFVTPEIGPFSGWLGGAVLLVSVPFLFRRGRMDADD